jgi:sphingomyelin phosphodiesterase acid-like 3
MRLGHRVVALLMAVSLYAHAVPAASTTAPVVMLSDIHFDPMHDPGKLAALRAAPVEKWQAIFDGPATAGADAAFAKLQTSCGARGVDTPWGLLKSSLSAEQQNAAHPLFVTVGGDFLAHGFDCRFRTLAPGTDAAALSVFAAKTVAFVAAEIKGNFGGAPVYFALGNNDSGCKDYHEDAHSAFLAADARSFAGATGNAEAAKEISAEFSALGDYAVALPAPMEHARLIVLQDIFESRVYADCNGKSEQTDAATQIAWLRAQLAKAKKNGESVWLMAHIPPGLDAYNTLAKHLDVCGSAKPVMFLRSEDLADVIGEYAGTIKLALFGHTHMDEMRVFRGADGAIAPGRLVPSITTTNGNKPAFTVAQVDAKRDVLMNWQVYVSPDGQGAHWEREYDYAQTYGEPDFSGASASALFAQLATGGSKSMSYARNYAAGDSGLIAFGLMSVWPAYVCSATEAKAAPFTQCMCAAKKK